jgi:signal transduction histidine kinase
MNERNGSVHDELRPLECYKQVLDSIDRGYITITLQEPCQIDLYGKAATILRLESEQELTLAGVFRLDATQTANFTKWLNIVRRLSAQQEWSKLVHIAPVRKLIFEAGSTPVVLLFNYKKICDSDGVLQRILIQIDDKTEDRQKQDKLEAEVHQRANEVRTILTVANTPQDELQIFLIDTETRLDKTIRTVAEQRAGMNAPDTTDTMPSVMPKEIRDRLNAIFFESVFRDLHTIKGNAATYGFSIVAEEAHLAESMVIHLKSSDKSRREDAFENLQKRLKKAAAEIAGIKKIVSHLFGREDEISVRIPKERIESIRRLCSRLQLTVDDAIVLQLIEQCTTLSWKPLSTLTRKYQRIVRKRAEIMHKEVDFIVENGHTLWPSDIFTRIDDAITHLMANAVIHGIESNKSRYEQSKGKAEIRFRAIETDTMLSISVTDNGRGINTNELVKRAVKRGIIPMEMVPTLTEAQKLELIFANGISTADSITELSGRGIGMDVVREQVRLLNGAITIFSETGKGTTFTVRIPNREKARGAPAGNPG